LRLGSRRYFDVFADLLPAVLLGAGGFVPSGFGG
jgi:hypothetical protein